MSPQAPPAPAAAQITRLGRGSGLPRVAPPSPMAPYSASAARSAAVLFGGRVDNTPIPRAKREARRAAQSSRARQRRRDQRRCVHSRTWVQCNDRRGEADQRDLARRPDIQQADTEHSATPAPAQPGSARRASLALPGSARPLPGQDCRTRGTGWHNMRASNGHRPQHQHRNVRQRRRPESGSLARLQAMRAPIGRQPLNVGFKTGVCPIGLTECCHIPADCRRKSTVQRIRHQRGCNTGLFNADE